MNIDILQLVEGARQAKGLTVIIDVFRAFSLACYLMENGAKTIIPVGEVETALKLKKSHPEYILIGERNERKPEGFDFGNSPAHIESIDFTEKTIIHTTSAGTQGFVNAIHAEELLTGSFVNASSIVKYINKQKPSKVSLVCMGYSAKEPADEDTFCAEWIRDTLLGKEVQYQAMVEKLRIGSGKRLLDPANHAHSPARDFELCTKLNRFNFVLVGEHQEGHIHLKKRIV